MTEQHEEITIIPDNAEDRPIVIVRDSDPEVELAAAEQAVEQANAERVEETDPAAAIDAPIPPGYWKLGDNDPTPMPEGYAPGFTDIFQEDDEHTVYCEEGVHCVCAGNCDDCPNCDPSANAEQDDLSNHILHVLDQRVRTASVAEYHRGRTDAMTEMIQSLVSLVVAEAFQSGVAQVHDDRNAF